MYRYVLKHVSCWLCCAVLWLFVLCWFVWQRAALFKHTIFTFHCRVAKCVAITTYKGVFSKLSSARMRGKTLVLSSCELCLRSVLTVLGLNVEIVRVFSKLSSARMWGKTLRLSSCELCLRSVLTVLGLNVEIVRVFSKLSSIRMWDKTLRSSCELCLFSVLDALRLNVEIVLFLLGLIASYVALCDLNI